MNVDMIDKTIEAIKAEVLIFRMDVYAEETACGTAACIAGHAVHIDDPDVTKRYMDYVNAGYPEDDPGDSEFGDGLICHGMKLLDITYDQADALFAPSQITSVRAQHAIDMLEWLKKHPDAFGTTIRAKWEELIYPPE